VFSAFFLKKAVPYTGCPVFEILVCTVMLYKRKPGEALQLD